MTATTPYSGSNAIPGCDTAVRILELRDIGVRFGQVEAVRDISFDVVAGEFISLLGPPGWARVPCCARSLANHPQAGQIRPHGAVVTAAPPQMRRIGMVFQNYALFPHMSVADNIAFGLRRQKPRAEVRTRVAENSHSYVSTDLVRRPAELSGGQQQRARSRALWPFDRSYCCLTSRSRRLISICGRRCSSRSSVCSAKPASRRSS